MVFARQITTRPGPRNASARDAVKHLEPRSRISFPDAAARVRAADGAARTSRDRARDRRRRGLCPNMAWPAGASVEGSSRAGAGVLTQNSKRPRKHRVSGAAVIPSSACSRLCPSSAPCSQKPHASLARQGLPRASSCIAVLCRQRCRLTAGRRSAPSLRAASSLTRLRRLNLYRHRTAGRRRRPLLRRSEVCAPWTHAGKPRRKRTARSSIIEYHQA